MSPMTTPSKPLAYSYVRMSTDVQIRGDSLRRQAELSKRYALAHDLHLVEDFKLEDIGISAFRGKNSAEGALARFLEAVDQGIVPPNSYLLVESFDRLSRQKPTEALKLFLDLGNKGIHLVTLADDQLYKAGSVDFYQLMYSLMIMSRANEESQIKSQRLGSVWQHKRGSVSQKNSPQYVQHGCNYPPAKPPLSSSPKE